MSIRRINLCWRCVVLLWLCLAASPGSAGTVQVTVDDYLRQHQQAGDRPNRLIEQGSPYLLQHAYNPVQWYPWGEAAFEAARKQDKPIFLSIGYSTCYWCHVMARESFENTTIADYLNKHFISIKVDREERPDIDNVYMMATQLINGHGGWPMTVFLDHDLRPFHAGTYYPPEDRNGHTGLTTLLQRIVTLWREQRDRIDRAAADISLRLQVMADEAQHDTVLDDDIMARALNEIASGFDDEYGGFSAAPKFPDSGILRFLATQARGSALAREMLTLTLDAMMQGGIHDRIGGGFHRYSVDAQWRLPHFEKMLYTQALMVMAYIDLYRISDDLRYLDIVEQTLAFVEREMRSPDGGFYSALDAESEDAATGKKTEGAYYLWRQAELERLLDKHEYAVVKQHYAIEADGNIHHLAGEELHGLNILAVDEDAPRLNADQHKLLRSARDKLFQARQRRPRPHLDDKIITAWNAMMAAAFAEAAAVTGKARYRNLAEQAMMLIENRLVDSSSQGLYRRLRNGEAGVPAVLDDYVWTVNAMLSLHRLQPDAKWLARAQRITRWQLQHFADEYHGGFYEAAHSPLLLFRSRSPYDGALPAANAVALDNLQQLAELTGDRQWQRLAQQMVGTFAASINASPSSAAWMLSLLR